MKFLVKGFHDNKTIPFGRIMSHDKGYKTIELIEVQIQMKSTLVNLDQFV